MAYFQRANPSLLMLTAPGATEGDEEPRQVTGRGAWSTMKPLWTALALLLGLLLLRPARLLAGFFITSSCARGCELQ